MRRSSTILDRPSAAQARRRIVAGARRHFLAQGFRGVTMDDLADELGMSKKTLYAHFPDKLAIVEAALLDKLGGIESELKRITTNGEGDFLSQLEQLLACVQREMAEIQPIFLRDVRREAPELFSLVETRRPEIIQRYFGKVFHDGRKAGFVRKDVPIKLMVEILIAATQTIMNPQKLGELGVAPKAAFSAIIAVLLHGIIDSKGKRKR